jgi:probable DNA metabolism protein
LECTNFQKGGGTLLCYIYDGTFEGLLTSIYEAYYNSEKPEKILKENEFIPTLLAKPLYINTDKTKASKVYEAIKTKISNHSLRYCFYVYLSEVKDSGTLIYDYVKLGFKIGKAIDMHLNEDSVLKLHLIVKKVSWEHHRMLGLVRFKDVDNKFLYADMEPDHNITALITPHFAERLSNENFIIHDTKRDIAAVYDKNEWFITSLDKSNIQTLIAKAENCIYESLWKDYFKSTTIQDRLNPKLQKMHMPKRYWKFLTEID